MVPQVQVRHWHRIHSKIDEISPYMVAPSVVAVYGPYGRALGRSILAIQRREAAYPRISVGGRDRELGRCHRLERISLIGVGTAPKGCGT